MEQDKNQRIQDIVTKSIYIIALAMSIYHIVASQYSIFGSEQHINVHLMFALVIIFLQTMRFDTKKRRIGSIVLLGLALATVVDMVYIHFHATEFQFAIGGQPFDKVFTGVVVILLVLTATYILWGKIIPIVAIIALLYGYFGDLFQGFLHHGGLSFPRLITYASTNFTGIYGMLASVSANTIVQFSIFAGLLEAFGALQMIIDVAMGASGKIRSGGAQVAVISSGLVGSISGSVAANIAMTGAFSIPLMKKRGYPAEFAAAVEACASTGGAILPPVMNAAAFIIASWLSVPYIYVVLIGFAPALLYYLGIAMSVYIRAIKINDEKIKEEQKSNARQALINLLVFVLPIVLLMVLMIMGYSTAKSLFYSTILLVVLGFIWQFKEKREKPVQTFFRKLLDGLAGGGKSVAGIAIVCACTGILVEILNATGLPSKMSQFALQMAGDNLFLLAVLVALTCLLFGMGMPSGPAYILAALLGAPALTALGVPLIVAHFFVFYFAEMSALTPPVAIGCLVASGLAKADFMKTCLQSLELGIAGFVLPFMFLYRPGLLLQGSAFDLIWAFVMTAGFLLCFIITCEGFFMIKLTMLERISFAVAAICFIVPIYMFDAVGLVLFAMLCALHVHQVKKGRRQTSRSL
ncbi:MAG TPA: TRAP transporter fused permease subunit [Candidatus Fournierella excrementigallinarum]|nr:TRAP transporter fused permease subunit [Candidatus Fournierella excrementigallinarum]